MREPRVQSADPWTAALARAARRAAGPPVLYQPLTFDPRPDPRWGHPLEGPGLGRPDLPDTPIEDPRGGEGEASISGRDACDAPAGPVVGGVTLFDSPAVVLATTDGDDFLTFVGRAPYSYTSDLTGHPRQGCVVFRVCLPPGLVGKIDADNKLGVVLLVSGTAGIGVGCGFDSNLAASQATSKAVGADDHLATALASGDTLVGINGVVGLDFGEPTDLRFATIQYNNPSYNADVSCVLENDRLTTPAQDYLDASNEEGDDNCGPAAVGAIEAAVQAGLALIRWFYEIGPEDVRLMVSSFSNGVACATGWMAKYATGPGARYHVHVLVDAEGPTDSYEQLVCADCVDVFGKADEECPGTPVINPGPLGVTQWELCLVQYDVTHGADPALANCHTPLFGKAFERYARPPAELAPALLAEYLGAGWERAPQLTSLDHGYDPGVLATDGAWFGIRSAGIHVARSGRTGGYVRIQAHEDHVQPDWYESRHAVRALLAAQSARTCGGGVAQDVFVADDTYVNASKGKGAPTTFSATPDPDDSSFADWPAWPKQLDAYGVFPKWAIRTVVLRWAYTQELAPCG